MPLILNGIRRIRTSGSNPAEGSARRWGWSSRWGSDTTASGRTFDPSKATTIAAVRRAVDIISQPISTFPLHVYQGAREDQREFAENESNAVIWEAPNPEVADAVFWETLLQHEVLRGNAFIFVVKDQLDRPLELWPVEPERIAVGRLRESVGRFPAGTKVYQVDDLDPMVDYAFGPADGPRGEIIHVLGRSSDGLVGISPLSEGADDFEQALIMREYASRYFNNEANPGGVLSTEQVIDKDAADETQARWIARYGSPQNVRVPAVLGRGVKWQTVSFNPEESQMLESRRYSLGEVGRRFGVPPHLLGDVERSTSWGAGITEQGGEFRVFTLATHMIRFERTIDRSLLRGTGQFVRWNPDAVLRANTKERFEVYEIGIRSRIITPNEARRRENLPPLPGGDEFPTTPAAAAASGVSEQQRQAAAELLGVPYVPLHANGNGHAAAATATV